MQYKQPAQAQYHAARIKYTRDLTLNKGESAFLDKLLKINWRYPLISSSVEQSAARKIHDAAKAFADKKGGNFLELFNRVKDDRQK